MQTWLCTLGMPDQTNQKKIMSTCRKRLCFAACKNQLHHSILSWNIVEMLHKICCCRHAWPHPSDIIVSTCGNYDYYHHKNQLNPSILSLGMTKILQICYCGYFEHDWLAMPTKLIVLICRNIWCLFACKNSNSSLSSFLKYCKDITNLIFWVLWAFLTMAKKNDGISL